MFAKKQRLPPNAQDIVSDHPFESHLSKHCGSLNWPSVLGRRKLKLSTVDNRLPCVRYRPRRDSYRSKLQSALNRSCQMREPAPYRSPPPSPSIGRSWPNWPREAALLRPANQCSGATYADFRFDLGRFLSLNRRHVTRIGDPSAPPFQSSSTLSPRGMLHISAAVFVIDARDFARARPVLPPAWPSALGHKH